MSEPTIFDRGDLVWVRVEHGYWKRGIVTDVFRAPVTKLEVVVVGGDGYYGDDVMPDTGDRDLSKPLYEDCPGCGTPVVEDRAGVVYDFLGGKRHTCPVPEPQSLRA